MGRGTHGCNQWWGFIQDCIQEDTYENQNTVKKERSGYEKDCSLKSFNHLWFYNLGFEDREIFGHFAVLTLLLPDFHRFLFHLPQGLVAPFFCLTPDSGKLFGKKIGHVGVIDGEFFCFTPKELAVQPCNPGRQLFDTFLQILNLFRLIFIGSRQRGYRGVQPFYRLG